MGVGVSTIHRITHAHSKPPKLETDNTNIKRLGNAGWGKIWTM